MRLWADTFGGSRRHADDDRWKPPVAPTRQEQFLLKRLDRVRKLLGFLRLQRHELFDEPFQEESVSMYRATGAGKDAPPPAMMAMAILVQGDLAFPMPRSSN